MFFAHTLNDYHDIGNSKYSILVDESTDKSVKKIWELSLYTL